jgi:molybdopterin converting factor small subunit
LRVLFYGRLADAVARELEVEMGASCSVAQLRDMIVAAHPDAHEALLNRRVRVCVGDRILGDDCIVGTSECVEFLAPVSGG